MSTTKRFSVIAGILSAVIVTGCGVRDTSEDGVGGSAGTGTGQTNTIGTDTSAVAGFWEPNFGQSGALYVVISEVGDWSYVREDQDENCYNVESLEITKLQEVDEYSLNDDGQISRMRLFINEGGSLSLTILGDSPSSAVYDPVLNIMAQDLQLCDS